MGKLKDWWKHLRRVWRKLILLWMEKADPVMDEQLQECLINFLARYRATPHTVTGQTPSELLNSRRIRTRLDLLHPNQEQVQRARGEHYMGKKFLGRKKVAARNNLRKIRGCHVQGADGRSRHNMASTRQPVKKPTSTMEHSRFHSTCQPDKRS